MASTIPVGEYIFRRLHQLGIRSIVGVPGDFNLNLLDHVYSVPDLRWVGTCNELNAAYAADGYARARSLPGVVVTTYGVGELSALNGIVGAYSEYVPVVHIVGNTSRDMQRNHTRIHHTLWMDKWDHRTYQKMAEPVAAATAFLDDESKVAAEVDRVIETAVKRRLPVYLFVPLDIQDSPIDAAPLQKPLNLTVQNVAREEAVAETGREPSMTSAFSTRTNATPRSITPMDSKLEKKKQALSDKTLAEGKYVAKSRVINQGYRRQGLGIACGRHTPWICRGRSIDGRRDMVVLRMAPR